MKRVLRILHLEDEPLDSEVVRNLLDEEDLTAEIECVDTMAGFHQALDRGCYELILSDYTLPGVDTFEALRLARHRCPEVPFIFLSGTIGEDTAIESLKMGASDYVLKQRPARLGSAVRRALQEAKEQACRRQTEQALHQSQEALRHSEAWLRLAIEAADLGIWDWYPASGQLNWSPRCKAMFGLGPGVEPTYELFLARLHGEDRERTQQAIQQAHDPRGNGRYDIEYRALQADGAYRWIRAKGRSFFAGEGARRRVVRMAGTTQDVTRHKHAELELEQRVLQSTAQLRESVAELEQFSYTMTHDMRAPLRAMQGFGELMRAQCAESLPPAHKDYLRLIVEAAARMDKLITDALDYAKIIRQDLALTSVDADALLRGMIESYPQFQPPQAQISIAGVIPKVWGNEAGLTQVLSNLLNNAIKFVPPGQIPCVRVRAELIPVRSAERGARNEEPTSDPSLNPQPSTLNAFVRLWFEDNGIGIPRDSQDRIWEMFQRLSKDYEGTGIGLALVRKVVRRMGGKAGVVSEPGQGSRFWVDLKPGET